MATRNGNQQTGLLQRTLHRPWIRELESFLPADERSRKVLGRIAIAGLVLRVLFVLWLHSSHAGNALGFDSKSYIDPARAFLAGGHFDTSPGSGIPMFERTPGYPAFIAFIYQLFGWTGQRQLVLLLAQALLGAVVIILIYVITSRCWGVMAGLIAAAIVAFDPYQIRASNWFLSEGLATFLIIVAVLCAYLAFGSNARKTRIFVLLGIALAAATLVRPTTYYFFVIPLGLCLLSSKRFGWRHAVVALVALMAPIVVLVGGWQVRNGVVVGSYRISGSEGTNLYYYRAPDTLSERDGISFAEARVRLHQQYPDLPEVANEYFTPPRGADQGVPFDRMAQRGLRVVIDNPVATARVTLRWLGTELTDSGMTSMRLARDTPFGSIPGSSALLTFLLFVLYAAAASGVVIAFRGDANERLGHVFAASLAVWILVISAGSEIGYAGQNGARFRSPVLPILAVFAAPVLLRIWKWIATKRRGSNSGEPAPAAVSPDAPGATDA